MAISKSRGCKFCRAKSVDCDRKKPRCSACVENDEACGGYIDLGNVFINITSNSPPPVWNRSHNAQKYLVLDMDSTPSPPRSTPARSTPELSECYQSQVPFAFAPVDDSIPQMAYRLTQSPEPAPVRISTLAYLFVDLVYKPPSTSPSFMGPLVPMDTSIWSWRLCVPQWVGKSQLLDTSIGALSAAFIGSRFRDQRLLEAGRSMYLDSLHQLQEAIVEPDATMRKDLIAANLVMGSIELFLSNGAGSSWLRHIEGGNELLRESLRQVTSPEGLEELHLHALNQGLFEALAGRQEYYFSQAEWRDCITALYSKPRANRNILFDMWCQSTLPLCNILKQADDLDSTMTDDTASKAQAASIILEALLNVEISLFPFQETLNMILPGPIANPYAPVPPVGQDPSYPLSFTSIQSATMHNLNWTSQLLIHSTRRQLTRHLTPDQFAKLDFMPDSSVEFASLILRSVPYCTSNTSFAAAECMFLPLYVTAGYYTRIGDVERSRWTVNSFLRIASEQNLAYCAEKLDMETGTILQSGPPLC